MKRTTKKKTAPKRKSPKKQLAVGGVPFHPYHIAAIAWIFFPGGSVPTTTADVPGLDAQIRLQNPTVQDQTLVTAQLNSVFAELQTFLSVPSQNTQFINGRTNFQTLLAQMNNLWDGKDSDITAALVASIASVS
jgi:hypothetical protein